MTETGKHQMPVFFITLIQEIFFKTHDIVNAEYRKLPSNFGITLIQGVSFFQAP